MKTLILSYKIPLAFFVLSLVVYGYSVDQIDREYEKLALQKEEMQERLKAYEQHKARLELEVMSQSDPRWIELTLIRILGVIPEGYKKIYFSSS